MKATNETQSSVFDESKVKSYFPDLFMGKVSAFMLGDPSAYLDGRALYAPNDPNSDTYFQTRIKQGLVNARSGGGKGTGLDITRMFDEINLQEGFLEFESQDLSEFALAEENAEFTEARIHNILNKVASAMLTADYAELSPDFQQLLNIAIPDVGYLGLLEEFKPVSLDLPNIEEMSADEIEQQKLIVAKQGLADAFMKAVIVCYGQKLIDLSEIKFPRSGWDMDVKSFADEAELLEYEFPEKLTVVRVGSGDVTKFYVYGNGDGLDWQLREVNEEDLPEVKFKVDKSKPSKRCYKMTQDNLARVGAHTLSEQQKIQNAQNEEQYLQYYRQVISPIQIISQKPISKDSFIVNSSDLKPTDELLVDLEQKKQVIDSRLEDLQRERKLVKDPVLVRKIDEYIKLYTNKQQQIEVIDYLLDEPGGNTRENILLVLDDTHESADELAAIELSGDLQAFADEVSTEINIEDRSELNVDGVTGENFAAPESIGQVRRRDLLAMVEDLQSKIKQDLQDNKPNIAEYKQTPIYFIMVMNKYSSNLSTLAGNVASAAESPKIGEALTLDVIEALRELSMLEYALTQDDVSRETIEKAQRFENSPLNSLAEEFSAAQESNNTQQMQTIAAKMANLPGREMIKLRLTNLQITLQKNSTAYAAIIRHINIELEFLEGATEDAVYHFARQSGIYAAALQFAKIQDMSSTHVVQKAKLKMDLKSQLDSLEKVYEINDIKDNLDDLLRYVGQGFNTQQSDSPERIKVLKKERMDLNKMILDAHDALNSLSSAAQSHAMRSPIVNLAASYAKICRMDEQNQPVELAKLDSSLESLVAPQSEVRTEASSDAQTTMFRRLVRGIISPKKSDGNSTDDVQAQDKKSDSNEDIPKPGGKF